jgi:hypothetical protein
MLIAIPRTGLSSISICRRALFCSAPERPGHSPRCPSDCFHTAAKRDPDSGTGLSPIVDSHVNLTRQAVAMDDY